MNGDGKGILGDWQATGEDIRQAWEKATIAAVEIHRRTGVPMACWDWENGRVVLIPADQVPVPDEVSIAGEGMPEGRA